MTDRTYVTFGQQRAAYDALGLDPDRYHDTASVVIQPSEVTVTRHLRRDGSRYLADDGHVATEVTTLKVVTKGPTP